MRAPGVGTGAYPPTVIINNYTSEEPDAYTEVVPCSMCGKVKEYMHLISFDSIGECYVDEEAGDMMCNDCMKKEEKRLKAKAGGT